MVLLKQLECYILDMDGTIYLGSQVIPGAKELISFFNEKSIPYYFFTNNSSKSPDEYLKKLANLGFGKFNKKSIITSADVTMDYIIKTYGHGSKVYVVGTESLTEQFLSRGFICTNDNPDCIVVGFDTSFCFEKAKTAVDLLSQGVPFYATNIDAVCPLENNMVLPDCSSICAMITHASGVSAKFLGKPSCETAAYIQNITKASADKTGVVGDRLYTDMKLALDNNMCAVGVLSGEMTKQDIKKSGMEPHYLFSSVKELYEILKESY